MTKPKDFRIVEMPCPECGHNIAEFVAQLVIDPRLVCFKCQNVFRVSVESTLSGTEVDSQRD